MRVQIGPYYACEPSLVEQAGYEAQHSLARRLAAAIPGGILAMAYRLAREREGALDQFNRGHLKP